MARNYYELGRSVRVRFHGHSWPKKSLAGTVVSERPLRVRIDEDHPIWRGAVVWPLKIAVVHRSLVTCGVRFKTSAEYEAMK